MALISPRNPYVPMILGPNGKMLPATPKAILAPETTSPPAPVKRYVNSERTHTNTVPVYKDYNNTRIANPSMLRHGQDIKVYPAIVGNGWNRIASGTYAGWYVQSVYLTTSPPKDEEEEKGEDESKKTTNPGVGTGSEPSNFTKSIITGLESAKKVIEESEAFQALKDATQKAYQEQEKFKASIKDASDTEFVPNDQLYNFRTIAGKYEEFSDSYQMAIGDFTNAFGSPFLYSNDTDPCYYGDSASTKGSTPHIGHTMMSTIYSSPAVFSICPGKVTYLPNLLSGDGKSIFEKMSDIITGKGFKVGAPESILGASGSIEGGGAFARQLYAFAPDYNDYINRLNVMARVSALFMGIGERETPWLKSSKYRNADYSFFTTGKRGTNDKKADAVSNFLWQLSSDLESGLDTNTDKYIHFFLTADGSAVEQDFITNNAPISMFDELNGGTTQNKVKEISFLFNGAMSSSETWETLSPDLTQLGDNIGHNSDTIKSLMNMVQGWAQGGRMLIPDMIDEVQYNSSVTCHLTFRSLYGDPESVFLNVNLPCLALLCFVLPKQMAENMYGYPYVCRCFQRGFYNSDLCFISNLSFRRGGDSESSWTESGLATEVEATFTITPLYSALMGGNGRNPYLFMSNTALIEYLGNMCGLDIKTDQLELKVKLLENLFKENFFQDIPNVLGRKTSDWARTKLDKIFNFN